MSPPPPSSGWPNWAPCGQEGSGGGGGQSPHSSQRCPHEHPWERGLPSQDLAKTRGPVAPQAKQAEPPPPPSFPLGQPRTPSCHPVLVTPPRVRVPPPSTCPTSVPRGWLCPRQARRKKVGCGGRSDPGSRRGFLCPSGRADSESRPLWHKVSPVPLHGGSVGVPRGGGGRCRRAGKGSALGTSPLPWLCPSRIQNFSPLTQTVLAKPPWEHR